MMPGWFFSRSVASAASSPTDMLCSGGLCGVTYSGDGDGGVVDSDAP